MILLILEDERQREENIFCNLCIHSRGVIADLSIKDGVESIRQLQQLVGLRWCRGRPHHKLADLHTTWFKLSDDEMSEGLAGCEMTDDGPTDLGKQLSPRRGRVAEQRLLHGKTKDLQPSIHFLGSRCSRRLLLYLFFFFFFFLPVKSSQIRYVLMGWTRNFALSGE